MTDNDIEKLLEKFSKLPRSAQAKVFSEMERLIDRLLKAGEMVEQKRTVGIGRD